MGHILAMTLAVLLSAGAVGAQDFDAGLEAANRGDFAAALKEWRPLAEAGDAAAQYNLGIMYSKGTGVPQDIAEAARLWRLAAEQGVADAQYNLGLMYAKGDGVAQDKAEAARLWRLAAEQGVAEVQTNLGFMYAKGDGVAQDNVQAHMRGNIGCALGNEGGCKLRDLVSEYMTPADISEAQRRARVCMESNFRDCD